MNDEKISNRINIFTPVVLLFGIFLFMSYLNIITPLWADDFCRIATSTTFPQAFATAVDRYINWNGRFFAHLSNYLVFGNIPSSLLYFNLLNSLFFTSLIYLIFKLVTGRVPRGYRDTLLLLLVFDLVFSATQGVGEIALWKTGSIGYLWGVVLELVSAIPLLHFVKNNEEKKLSTLEKFIYPAAAFAGSMFIEHMSLAFSAVFVFISYTIYSNKKKLSKTIVLVTALHLLGTVLLFSSKGNFLKATVYEMPLQLNQRIVNNLDTFADQTTLGWIFVLFWFVSMTNVNFFANLKKPFFWHLFAIGVGIILCFSILPTEQLFNFRRVFPFEIIAIMAIIFMAEMMPKSTIFEITLLSFLVVSIFGNGLSAIKEAQNISLQVESRNNLIATQIANGISNLRVPEINMISSPYNQREIINKYNYKSDISSDPNHWTNTCFSKAHGIQSIITSTK